VQEVEETLGSVDLLVNNAGLAGPIGPNSAPLYFTYASLGQLVGASTVASSISQSS
jgi:hypothetical protein